MNIDRVLEILEWRQDRLETMLTRLGWPLPGDLGCKWLDDVADSFFAGALSEQDVADVFLDKYQKHGLSDVRQSWQNDRLLADRLPILLEALDAHEHRQFFLSVPVLLAQLEGLIADAKGHKGRFTRKTLAQYLEPIVASGSRFERVAARFVMNVLWGDFHRGEKMPTLNRHAILHGADMTYGTAANSLRAVLYVDNVRRAIAPQETV